ncbi:hypothetical protein NDU88_003506 [Pleurodeles waltl]|uniref:Uncharacterized protein n=1 Tax=Pleurodeles waltl TaxID=8319 RepID=A0AAV7UCN8_PLEWA|nr:hypothetical protein NDU88_003506 [Pleurodeles waltl]
MVRGGFDGSGGFANRDAQREDKLTGSDLDRSMSPLRLPARLRPELTEDCSGYGGTHIALPVGELGGGAVVVPCLGRPLALRAVCNGGRNKKGSEVVAAPQRALLGA